MTYCERILYVDDDALCRRSFAREMRQAGFIIDVAKTGEEALVLTQRYPYAVLAADWRMPGLDGVRLVEEVRKQESEPTCLLVTGASDSALQKLNEEALGLETIIRKPWNTLTLTRQLRLALDLHLGREKERLSKIPNKTDSLRVLVIEGNTESANRLEELLLTTTRENFHVEQVRTLLGAAKSLEQKPADIVLAALESPTGENVDIVRRVLGAQPSAPIIALGNSDHGSLSLAAVQAGAQDFLLRSEIESNLLVRSIQHAIERKRSEERLAHIAHHDQLTGLANRALLAERLDQAIARARRKDAHVAVFFLDLDRFKSVNDTLGHDAGDELLQHVSRRLLGSVRETDTVARLGGDEFAIVLEDLDRSEEATLLAGRVLNSFATPFRLEAGEVITTTSIGIAVHPHNGQGVEDLLKCADSAMYRAKQTGRDNYQFFSEELHAQAVRQIELESALRTAVDNDEFVVHYQPQVNVANRQVVGMEALVRWRRPNNVLLPPSAFIPILEETGLIIPVGEEVLRRACGQLKAWNASSKLNLRMAVNISARQFEDPGFVDVVARALQDHGLQGPQLELEITETVLMRDTTGTVDTFERLRKLGVRIAIDDFGTGYSSLAYLKTFPIDALKIDRSFLKGVGESFSSATLASAVIALGATLQLDVIAEGVETEAQLRFLRQQECKYVQGFLLGHPANAAETTLWLRDVIEAQGQQVAPAPLQTRRTA